MANFIKPNKSEYTSYFGQRFDPVTKEKDKTHYGLDFGSIGDDNVISTAEGIVIRTINQGELGGFGNFIVISHVINGKPFKSIYAHLNSLKVKIGDKVKQGQLIGIKGNTGKSTGKHLHFEIHKGNNKLYSSNEAIDPYPLIETEEKENMEKKLNEKQEKIRKEAMELGITDGKNPFTMVNQYYVWNAMLGMAKEIKGLKEQLNLLKK